MKESWSKLLGLASGDNKITETENIVELPLNMIESNPYQPRSNFDEDRLQELKQSIKTYGLLQPIIVRELEDRYQIVAGERRFMALERLGRTTASAIIRNFSDSAMAALAMIENLQRENLSFIEEAEGYEKLLKEFGLTQEVLAQRLGRSQSTIANKLRLLKLPEAVQQKISTIDLTERHARSLLRLPNEELQLELLGQISNEGLNVKQTEERVSVMLQSDAEVEEENKKKGRKKPVIRDVRIFLNTIRQAVTVIEDAGLEPSVEEEEHEDRIEINISLPKQTPDTPKK